MCLNHDIFRWRADCNDFLFSSCSEARERKPLLTGGNQSQSGQLSPLSWFGSMRMQNLLFFSSCYFPLTLYVFICPLSSISLMFALHCKDFVSFSFFSFYLALFKSPQAGHNVSDWIIEPGFFAQFLFLSIVSFLLLFFSLHLFLHLFSVCAAP